MAREITSTGCKIFIYTALNGSVCGPITKITLLPSEGAVRIHSMTWKTPPCRGLDAE